MDPQTLRQRRTSRLDRHKVYLAATRCGRSQWRA